MRSCDQSADAASNGFSISVDEVAQAAASRLGARAGRRIEFDPETVERDLTRLVLTLIEFVRQLLEAQAVRRMERGRLTPEQEEKLGATLMAARERLVAVAAEFGIEESELTMELGPLGKLV